MIFFGENMLRKTITEFNHAERNQQGQENRLIHPDVASACPVAKSSAVNDWAVC
jgi:hypothetical protein